jgi:uncharacterized protein
MELPEELGIMILPETVFFPHNLIPLHIFEPRYRLMLSQALEGERMFALSKPRKVGREILPQTICGIGLIRACVQSPDGSSNLILQGVTRVRFAEFTKKKPYFIGRAVELEDDEQTPNPCENEALATQILQQVNRIQDSTESLPPELREFLSEIKDFHMLVDIIAGSFIRHPERKQQLLETAGLNRRLHILALSLCQEYPAP